MAGEKITVDRDALIQVLNALIAPGHRIRELQATRSLHALGGDYTNPIETLLAEVRALREPMPAAETYVCKAPAGFSPDVEPEGFDGHDYEGFPGGCARMGCKPPAEWTDKQLWDLYWFIKTWADENRVNGENCHGRATSHAKLVAHLATLGAKP